MTTKKFSELEIGALFQMIERDDTVFLKIEPRHETIRRDFDELDPLDIITIAIRVTGPREKRGGTVYQTELKDFDCIEVTARFE